MLNYVQIMACTESCAVYLKLNKQIKCLRFQKGNEPVSLMYGCVFSAFSFI